MCVWGHRADRPPLITGPIQLGLRNRVEVAHEDSVSFFEALNQPKQPGKKSVLELIWGIKGHYGDNIPLNGTLQ